MSNLYSTANKANANSFEAINAELLKAEQALQVQRRIPTMLAEIDQDLLQKRAELSQLVTDLKWKKYALDKSRKRTVATVFYGFLGRRKEWQTAVPRSKYCKFAFYEKII